MLVDSAKVIIDQLYRPDGYNIGVNVGAAAGQTVFHLHIHLIPRFVGDVDDPRGGVRHVIPAKANYTLDLTGGTIPDSGPLT
jgi:diadenosine tetraphosphate (Ap4A) HIT family hydrolase